MLGAHYLLITALMFQLPFRVLALTQPALVAAQARLLASSLCPQFFPGSAACVRGALAALALRGLLLPLGVTYIAELLARRVFLASAAEAGGGGGGAHADRGSLPAQRRRAMAQQ